MTKIAEETFANVRTVKAFSNEEWEIKMFTAGNKKVYDAGVTKSLYTGLFTFINQVFLYGAMVFIIWTGGNMYLDGESISLGDISTYMLYMNTL